MFSIPSFYELGSCSDAYDVVGMLNQNLSPRSMAEAKAVAAGISHKEAERRRRKRINGHIATLKSILPNTIKTDKASLLGEAVRRMKELKKTVAEQDEGKGEGGDYPSEGDELKVSQCEITGLIKAALSCDDRPEIILDMIEALKAAEAKVVRAEMATVGGRTKTVLWVRLGPQNDAELGGLKRALKMVMDKSTSSGQARKRARYHHL